MRLTPAGAARFLNDLTREVARVNRAAPASVITLPPHERCNSAHCEECRQCGCTATTAQGCPVHDPDAAREIAAREQAMGYTALDDARYAARWHRFLALPDDC